MPEPINILSAGAVSPGLVRVIDAFRRDSGNDVAIAFATAPELRKRLNSAESAHIVIAPLELLDELPKSALSAGRVMVGRIGVGVTVRDGAPLPRIATVEELKQSLLHCESIVFNQASTGLYIDSLFKRLGIAAQTEAKIVRCADFAAVREHVSKGRSNAIGFGATTVIVESAGKGVKFAGPLPAEIQNYTAYAAALTSSAGKRAAAFMDYLAMPAAKSILKTVGID
jgi:molybdate transport system substrate-binding protein